MSLTIASNLSISHANHTPQAHSHPQAPTACVQSDNQIIDGPAHKAGSQQAAGRQQGASSHQATGNGTAVLAASSSLTQLNTALCSGNMEQARSKLKQILWAHRATDLSATMQQLLHKHCKPSACSQKLITLTKIVLLCVLGIFLLSYYHTEMQGRRCALSLPRSLRYALRPPEQCDFCAKIKSVPRLSQLSCDTFEADYAYSGAPVIVSDAMQNWTATKLFNYGYFRDVYRKAKRKQRIRDCQFLPYKTGFQDIYEALDMPQSRIELQPNETPWYFGWSNCHAETAEEFRKHYGRPYFLPERSENNAVDWFFMGTAGLGAQMHIDNVRLPSWQAQLAGSKRWLLVPPPECYFQCRRFDVVVQQGDIIVLDTNKWYHQTFVQPGAVSLTIGAEYD